MWGFSRIPNHKKYPDPQTKAQKVRELELMKREKHKKIAMGYGVSLGFFQKMQRLEDEINA